MGFIILNTGGGSGFVLNLPTDLGFSNPFGNHLLLAPPTALGTLIAVIPATLKKPYPPANSPASLNGSCFACATIFIPVCNGFAAILTTPTPVLIGFNPM